MSIFIKETQFLWSLKLLEEKKCFFFFNFAVITLRISGASLKAAGMPTQSQGRPWGWQGGIWGIIKTQMSTSCGRLQTVVQTFQISGLET